MKKAPCVQRLALGIRWVLPYLTTEEASSWQQVNLRCSDSPYPAYLSQVLFQFQLTSLISVVQMSYLHILETSYSIEDAILLLLWFVLPLLQYFPAWIGNQFHQKITGYCLTFRPFWHRKTSTATMQRYDAHRTKLQLAQLLFGVTPCLLSFHSVFALCYLKSISLRYAQFDYLHGESGQSASLFNSSAILWQYFGVHFDLHKCPIASIYRDVLVIYSTSTIVVFHWW